MSAAWTTSVAPCPPDLDERRTCRTWGRDTTYRLRAWMGPRVAVVTELAANEGPSVQNAAEHVWADALTQLSVSSMAGLRWVLVEHFGDVESYGAGPTQARPDRLSQVDHGAVLRQHADFWAPLDPAVDAWLREALT